MHSEFDIRFFNTLDSNSSSSAKNDYPPPPRRRVGQCRTLTPNSNRRRIHQSQAPFFILMQRSEGSLNPDTK
jgi:hypothetical protein